MSDGTEHLMHRSAIVLERKEIELSYPGLVSKNREVLKETQNEYECSCGESFEVGRDAYEHLLDVHDIDTERGGSGGD